MAGEPAVPDTVRVAPGTLERIALREQLQAAALAVETGEIEVALSTHSVGSRCEVAPGGRRGTVRFVGCVGGIPRPLVAVELDLAQGSDTQRGGTWIDGHEYFRPSNPDAAVIWKQPADVTCGDFPEEDPFANLSDSDTEAMLDEEAKASSAAMLDVQVCGFTPTGCTLPAELGWSVRDLKGAIEAVTGVPKPEQRLQLAGASEAELHDFARLERFSEGQRLELLGTRRPAEQARWIELVKEDPDGSFLASAPAHICADREVMMAAVIQNGRALEFASEALRADRELVLSALAEDGDALAFADYSLWADRTFVIEAVRRSGLALGQAVLELQADRALVLEAVGRDGLALRYAAEHLRADVEIVTAAIEENPEALKYADKDLQSDNELRRVAGIA